MSELNREQIIKDIEELLEDHCGFDYKYSEKICGYETIKDALALIKELIEENKDLQKQFHILDMECGRLEKLEDKYHYGIQEIKTNTTKKMQERLNERIDKSIDVFDFQISECNAIRQALRGVKNDIYQVAKEILEENDGK